MVFLFYMGEAHDLCTLDNSYRSIKVVIYDIFWHTQSDGHYFCFYASSLQHNFQHVGHKLASY